MNYHLTNVNQYAFSFVTGLHGQDGGYYADVNSDTMFNTQRIS